MGRFSGVKPSGAGGQFYLPGTYLVRCERMSIVKARKGDDQFTIESTVLESSNPEVPVGSRRTAMIPYTDDAMGFIMAAAMAHMQLDASAPVSAEELADIEAAFETFIAPDDAAKKIKGNAAKGEVVRVEAYHVAKGEGYATTRSGARYVATKFYPAPAAA